MTTLFESGGNDRFGPRGQLVNRELEPSSRRAGHGHPIGHRTFPYRYQPQEEERATSVV